MHYILLGLAALAASCYMHTRLQEEEEAPPVPSQCDGIAETMSEEELAANQIGEAYELIRNNCDEFFSGEEQLLCYDRMCGHTPIYYDGRCYANGMYYYGIHRPRLTCSVSEDEDVSYIGEFTDGVSDQNYLAWIIDTCAVRLGETDFQGFCLLYEE